MLRAWPPLTHLYDFIVWTFHVRFSSALILSCAGREQYSMLCPFATPPECLRVTSFSQCFIDSALMLHPASFYPINIEIKTYICKPFTVPHGHDTILSIVSMLLCLYCTYCFLNHSQHITITETLLSNISKLLTIN